MAAGEITFWINHELGDAKNRHPTYQETDTMLNEQMEKALNDQVNAELYSGYLYLSMSSYFSDKNLPGFASWMRVQAQEELAHGMKLYDFIDERRGRNSLQSVPAPQSNWESTLGVFERVLEHEIEVTTRINKLVDLAVELSDHATNNFLQWFVAEQVEEEASADEIIQRLKLVGDDGAGIFMLDRELATRTFVMPV